MQSIGIITPVTEPTDWVSSVVAAHKKAKPEIRLCINAKDSVEVATQMSGATVFSVLDAKNSFWQICLDKKCNIRRHSTTSNHACPAHQCWHTMTSRHQSHSPVTYHAMDSELHSYKMADQWHLHHELSWTQRLDMPRLRERDSSCGVCLHEIQGLYIWKAYNCRLPASWNNRDEVHSHHPCPASENVTQAAVLRHQPGLQKGQIHVSGRHSVKSPIHADIPEYH